jgi:hypothetical protein
MKAVEGSAIYLRCIIALETYSLCRLRNNACSGTAAATIRGTIPKMALPKISRLSFLLALGSSALTGAACSPSSGNGNGDKPGGSAGANGTAGGANGDTGGSSGKTNGGAAGALTDPGAGGTIVLDPGMTTRPTNEADASCGTTTATAEQTVITKTITTQSPVALFLVQDRSGSMVDDPPVNSNQNKWQQAVGAVNAFVADPKSSGLDVALGFFPIATGMCDGSTYATPNVPLARLPSTQLVTDVSNALSSNAPSRGGGGSGNGSSGTPIEGALRGGENYCLVYQANNPQEKCVVVLITDGAPNGCDENFMDLSNIAADAKKQNVTTFAIGMNGADFTLLDQIATAGGSSCGTTPACNVANGTTSFSDALNAIRTTVTQTMTVVQSTKLACEYNIPPPKDGEKLDFTTVNEQITANGTPTKVLRVKDEPACASVGNLGWYYDNENDPKSVRFCPSTCSSVEVPDAGLPPGTTAPRVDVLFGCKSEPAVPA